MATLDEMLSGQAGGEDDTSGIIATDQAGAEGGDDPVRKDVANYRPSDDPSRSCGTCANFVPPEGCTEVLGQISESGVSDRWEPAETEELLQGGVEDFLYGGGA